MVGGYLPAAIPRTRAVSSPPTEPTRPTPDLANSLDNLKAGLRDVGACSDALATHDAVTMRCQPAATESARHTTTSRIAARWGFSRTGRLRLAYQRVFHETPDQTLHR